MVRVTDQSVPFRTSLPALAGMAASELRTKYQVEERLLRQLATACNCSIWSVARALDYYHIARRRAGAPRVDVPDAVRADILVRYRAGGTVPEIATQVGCS